MQFFRPLADVAEQQAALLVPSQEESCSSEPQPLDDALLAMVAGSGAPGSGW